MIQHSISKFNKLYIQITIHNLESHPFELSQDLYNNLIESNLSSLSCPNPSCDNHNLSIHSHYQRNIVYAPNLSKTIDVSVAYCKACKTFHTLLPSYLVPNLSYTYSFVIMTLILYWCVPEYRHNKSKVCTKMCIGYRTFNIFLKLISPAQFQRILSYLQDNFVNLIKSKNREWNRYISLIAEYEDRIIIPLQSIILDVFHNKIHFINWFNMPG